MKKEPIAREVELSQLAPSKSNPRTEFDKAMHAELVASIKQHGIINPILVRPSVDGFEIVAGERRYRAAKELGLEKVPVTIRQLTDTEMIEIQLVENINREDLTPLDEGECYEKLVRTCQMTVAMLAARTGKAPQHVSKRLSLAHLHPQIKDACKSGKLTYGAAYHLSRIPDRNRQLEAYNYLNERQSLGASNVESYIKRGMMVKLSDAPFDLSDAILTGAGSCTECPYRSGNNGLLFDDIDDQTCTKPDCYGDKVTRFFNNIKESGEYEIATAAQMERIFNDGYSGISTDSPWTDIDKKCAPDPKGRTFRELVKGSPLKMLLAYRDTDYEKKIYYVVGKKELEKYMAEHYDFARKVLEQTQKEVQSKKQERDNRKLEKKVVNETAIAIATQVSKKKPDLNKLLPEICLLYILQQGYVLDSLLKTHGAKIQSYQDRAKEAKRIINNLSSEGRVGFFIELLCVPALENSREEPHKVATYLLKQVGINIDEVREKVTSEVKSAVKEEKKNAVRKTKTAKS